MRFSPIWLLVCVGGCANPGTPPPSEMGDAEATPNYGTGGTVTTGGAGSFPTGGVSGTGATYSNGGLLGSGGSGALPATGGTGGDALDAGDPSDNTGGTSNTGGASTGGTMSGGTGGACPLPPFCPAGTGGAATGGTAGAATGGTGGAAADAGSCDNAVCFDVFDCVIWHLDLGYCGFTKCENFVCKP